MRTIHVLGLGMAMLVTSIASTSQAATTDSVNRQVQSLNKRLSKQENRLRINGFASLGATFSDEDLEYNNINNETNFRRNTKAGVQMTFNLDSQSSVVTQMVSRGTNDFETKMEWAYFKHELTPSITAKLGRIRAPFYMLSEYLDVGYAVPWATMPQETYVSLGAFSNMDGADITHQSEFGGLLGTLQLAYGRIDGTSVIVDDLVALGYTLAGDAWQVRAAYSQSNVASEFGGVGLYGDDASVVGTFASLGFTYDPGDLYVAAEGTQLKVDGSIGDSDSAYVTFGYRFGQFLPHITYAQAESTDDEDRELSKVAEATGVPEAALGTVGSVDPTAAVSATNPSLATAASLYTANFNQNTQRIGLGLRWDYTSGVAIKFQYDIITTDDEPGLFASDTADATAYLSEAAAGDEPDSTNIVSITIDTVF